MKFRTAGGAGHSWKGGARERADDVFFALERPPKAAHKIETQRNGFDFEVRSGKVSAR